MTRRSLPIALLLVLTASACGGGGATAGETTTTTPIVTTTTAAPTTTTTVDPGTLPQTDERPTGSGTAFDERMTVLARAIVANDADAALSTFFPLEAYKQIKAIPDPASDWRSRLIGAFRTDVTKAHAQLGPNAGSAKFLGVRVPDTAVWVTPGQEYNKGPYWRVFKSQMDFSVDGRTVSIPIESMISWRGQWYVVHLGPFR